MNNVTIAGQLGRDAETRHLGDGTPILSFSVADSQGRDKPTIWWPCNLFGKRGESLAQYLTKGQAVTVSGQITEREYTDKNGNQRKAMEIRVADVALQGGKREAPAASQKPMQPANRGAGGSSGFSDMDDDVPFTDPMKNRVFSFVV